MGTEDWTNGRLAAAMGVLLVAGTGICVAQYSSASLTISEGAAGFFANVLGGFGADALKKLHKSCFGRTGGPIDEHQVILRQLRQAQLVALQSIVEQFEADLRFGVGSEFFVGGEIFLDSLKDYLHSEERRAKTLTEADLASPTEADRVTLEAARQRQVTRTSIAVRTSNVLRAPLDFNAALSARHGGGPLLDTLRAKATDMMLVELLVAVSDEIPTAFELLLKGGPDGIDGWFALFIRDAAARVREVPGFRDIWQAEQEALLRVMLSETAVNMLDVRRLAEDNTEALVRHGALLHAIADTTVKTRELLRELVSRLNDVSNWLFFNLNFAIDGWLRFHALNRAIPFLGRDVELERLRSFLNSDDTFSWWIVTGPGGAGKTRLALELCARMHARGWQVGFLREKFGMPAAGWLPSRPILIIADYATEHIDQVRELTLSLATLGEGVPAIRLLLLERSADQLFLKRFYSSSGTIEGAIRGVQYREEWLNLPNLHEDNIWALVEKCPWRDQPTKLPLNRKRFFARLDAVDKHRRALVAMLIADDEIEEPGQSIRQDLSTILRKLLRNARNKHWPRELGAVEQAIGTAHPADALIAAATMTGQISGSFLTAVERQLEAPVSAKTLDLCAHAIGSPSYVEERRLDGIEPDLIGEFFALEALIGDPRDPVPFPWLPELAWRADEKKMAAFVLRSFQNFPEHPALEQISIAVQGVSESWQMYGFSLWTESPIPDETNHFVKISNLLFPASQVEEGAAIALARTCVLQSNYLSTSTPVETLLKLIGVLFDLSTREFRSSDFRMTCAEGLRNVLFFQIEEDRPDTLYDMLLHGLRNLYLYDKFDADVRGILAYTLHSLILNFGWGRIGDHFDQFFKQLCEMHATFPSDARVRYFLARVLERVLRGRVNLKEFKDCDVVLQQLRDLQLVDRSDQLILSILVDALQYLISHWEPNEMSLSTNKLKRELLDLHNEHPENEELLVLASRLQF